MPRINIVLPHAVAFPRERRVRDSSSPEDLKDRMRKVMNQIDRIISSGGKVLENDPLNLEYKRLRSQLRSMGRDSEGATLRSGGQRPETGAADPLIEADGVPRTKKPSFADSIKDILLGGKKN